MIRTNLLTKLSPQTEMPLRRIYMFVVDGRFGIRVTALSVSQDMRGATVRSAPWPLSAARS